MESPDRRSRLRSFALGGLVGAAGAVAALRRVRAPARRAQNGPAGLAAFEGAPCFRELVEREGPARDGTGDPGRTGQE